MKQKIPCIYAIKDLRNNKVIYIGQTKNFKKRKNEHFREKSTPIDKYMFEQDRENFEMQIIKKLSDNISKEEILNLEDKYILKYNTIEYGLNKRMTNNNKIPFFMTKRYMEMMEQFEKTTLETIKENLYCK